MITSLDRLSLTRVTLSAALALVTGCSSFTAADPKPELAPEEHKNTSAEQQTPAVAEKDSPDASPVHAMLAQVLPEVRFEELPLSTAIEQIRKQSGLNMFINWNAIETAGIDSKAPVSIQLRDVTVSKALKVLLDEASSKAGARLAYAVDENVVTISTGDDIARLGSTRVYDIRDLLEVPEVDPEDPSTAAMPQPPEGQPGQYDNRDRSVERVEKATANVIRVILESVSPHSWRASGGSAGSVEPLQGQLIVTQTAENHALLADLLEQIRTSRNIQVSVEEQLLTVPDELAKTLLADPAFNVGRGEENGVVGLVDDAQAKRLLRLVQANAHAEILVAPRLTLQNGQRAHARAGEDVPYISGISMVQLQDGGTRYEPVASFAQTGTIFDVRSVVSGDRRYVTLTLTPKLVHLLEMKSIPFASAPAEQKLSTQEPRLHMQQLRTTISVPAGRYVLVGPFTMAPDSAPATKAMQDKHEQNFLLVRAGIAVQTPARRPASIFKVRPDAAPTE